MMIKANGLLFAHKNFQTSDRRYRKRIILRAVVINILIMVYYFSHSKSTEVESVDYILPYSNVRSDLFLAPKYHIISCGIRKSMSQLLINIMCLLHNEREFKRQKRSLNDTWLSERVCSHQDPFFHVPQRHLQSFTNLTKIAFVRDPFDRFISFYLHICQSEQKCWDCGDDMRCVVRKTYDSLSEYQKEPNEVAATLVDRHAGPISWNCNFRTHLSEYHMIEIGADGEKRQTAIAELSEILTRHGVSDKLVGKISNESITGETFHGTYKSSGRARAERQVKEDPVVREYLHKIYFFDYLLFKFDRSHLDEKYQKLLDAWESSRGTR